MSNPRRLIFFDCEVFLHDWLFVFIDYNTKKRKVIHNNREELIKFYDSIKNISILCGYNSTHYDNVILKAILIGEDKLGWSIHDISNAIVKEGLSPFQISNNFYKFDIVSYDCMTNRFASLKLLEGYMGEMIKESDVSFDIKRPLTNEELKETIYYCTHDVIQTIKVFENTKSDFEAHVSLIQQFGLPVTDLSKTKARLTAEVLSAKPIEVKGDEFEYEILECIKLNKYKYIKDWFLSHRGEYMWDEKKQKQVKKKLVTNVYGLECTYASGGLHGALKKYYINNKDGSVIIHSDVASLYPSIMIKHNLLSRAVEEPSKYEDVLKTRLALKHAGKKKEQAPYKIVLQNEGLFKTL